MGRWKKFFHSIPYFVQGGRVFIGHQIVEPDTFLTVQGLYKKNGIKDVIGFLKPRENIEGKVEFLEGYLDRTDKSGYQSKDMVVKNDRLRLKLMENHYQNYLKEKAPF